MAPALIVKNFQTKINMIYQQINVPPRLISMRPRVKIKCRGDKMLTFDKKLIGKKLQMARKEKGYTQEHLSELVGISNRTLNLMEKGKSGMKLETLIKFCNSLDVSPNYILSYKSNGNDEGISLNRFTPEQQKIIKEFLDTFEKLSDTIYKSE